MSKGVDLAAATRQLRGAHVASVHVDWIAVDTSDSVAVFLGDEHSPRLSDRAKAVTVSDAVETIARAVLQRGPRADRSAYRVAAARALEPIYDVPAANRDEAFHERPFDGYPHLVVSSLDGGPVIRALAGELGGREVMSRAPFAAAFDGLGCISYQEIHDAGACGGCRAIDDPSDPMLRSPATLTRAGLYVYAHVPGESGEWMRVASPNVPIRRAHLLDAPSLMSEFVPLDVRFEDASWIVL